MSTPYDRLRQQAARRALSERAPALTATQQLLGALNIAVRWVVLLGVLAVAVAAIIVAGLDRFAGVNLPSMVRDYRTYLDDVRATQTAGPLAPAAPRATLAPVALPAAPPQAAAPAEPAGAGLSVGDVEATAATWSEPTPIPAQYEPETSAGTRVGGSWEAATPEAAPAFAPSQPEPTAIPERYEPATTGGTRVGGSWGQP